MIVTSCARFFVLPPTSSCRSEVWSCLAKGNTELFPWGSPLVALEAYT